MNQTDNNKEYSEIDLAEIPKKMVGFLKMLNNKINGMLFFLMKKAKIIVPLFIIGFGIGAYLDSKPTAYKHEVIVYPNFESIDYLNSKIEFINSKIKLRDTLFLKSLKIDKKLKLSSIKVIPITDPFLMVDEKKEYLDLVKLLVDGSDMDKFLTSEMVVRKFKSQKIEFVTGEIIKDQDKVIENIIDYLNDNEHFENIRKQEVANIQNSIKEYDLMNQQANEVLKSINNRNSETQKNDNISINNEYISYNDVLRVKEEMLENRNKLALDLVAFDKTIKDIQTSKNLIHQKFLKGLSKFVFAFLFVFLYIFTIRFTIFIKKYKIDQIQSNQA
ncbi:MAG: hypothetical protein ACOVLC_05225 [Flavobacterium sp.]